MHEKIKKILVDNELYTIPIDIVQLAKKCGFTVLQQELDYDGAIIAKKESFSINDKSYTKAIIVNINQIGTRKRFTIAHELAHWFMAPENERNDLFAHRTDSLTISNREPKINNFASELLMPIELISQALQNVQFSNEISPNFIIYIADLFGVSYAAAQVRLEKYVRGQ